MSDSTLCCRRLSLLLAVLSLSGFAEHASAAKGRVLVPTVTGREGMTVLEGHPGWIDCFAAGYGKSTVARIREDGTFELDVPQKPSALMLMFDRIETPPIVIPQWPVEEGNDDIVLPVEYSCVPPGPSDTWNEDWIEQRVNVYQSFVARGTMIYGLSMFIRPQQNPEANKYQMMFHAEGPHTKALMLTDAVAPDPGWSNAFDRVAGEKNHTTLVRAGYRHGDMPVEPGKTYAIRAEAYRSHGGKQFHLHSYVRPDNGDGYTQGLAFIEERPSDGDLCCLIFSDAHGQYVENQIRTEDWEIFLPGHRPTTEWGQTFVNHGASLAGISFWAVSANDEQVMGEVRIREEGEWGKVLDPVKIFRSRPSPHRPRITYPDIPGPVEGYADYYTSTPKLFQVAWLPDELKLEKDKTYYIDIVATKPLLMFADGHFYQHGHAYYEGLKVERQPVGRRIFHSARWTLLMNIVTYARLGGVPLVRAR